MQFNTSVRNEESFIGFSGIRHVCHEGHRRTKCNKYFMTVKFEGCTLNTPS